jgi:solute carrier family 30 (zinc transporter), member 5/7
MFVELVYGYMSNSLGLISDSFHMLFDCTALFIGLCASYIAKLPPNRLYTYGFGRIETLSGLFNGIFLVFIAFNVFCESIERIFEP